MGRSERLASMYVISDLSFYAVAHPNFKMAWNTMEHLTSGRVKVGIENLSKTNSNDSRGSYDHKTNTMYFNIGNPNLLKDSQGLMRTAAHEINHALNSRGNNNRVETFLEEYRAFYVQGGATGEYPPSSLKMKQHVTTLLNHHLYNFSLEKSKDAGFRKVVDTILLKLDNGEVMNPEELRQKLLSLPGREKSAYLNIKPNMDNH
jgi:hypothetical protein